jgi:hypothetical protein
MPAAAVVLFAAELILTAAPREDAGASPPLLLAALCATGATALTAAVLATIVLREDALPSVGAALPARPPRSDRAAERGDWVDMLKICASCCTGSAMAADREKAMNTNTAPASRKKPPSHA